MRQWKWLGRLFQLLHFFVTLSNKFKATVKGLQSWSHKKFGHVNSQLGLAREVLHQLKIAQNARILSSKEKWLRDQLKKHSLALSSIQRTIARSRSCINWLSEGDANTTLFHFHARHHKRKKFICKLVSDEWHMLTSHEKMEKNIHHFNSNILGESLDQSITVNLNELNIPRLDLSDLKAPFTKEKKSGEPFARCHLTKARGQMDLPGIFIKHAGL